MKLPKVTIQIVTWNSLKFLPFCLKAIFNQTYRDFQVLVIDNNSQDGTVDFLRRNYPEVTVFQNKKNLGFAKANNQGIKLFNSSFVVVCNPDIVMAETWLEKIMAQAEKKQYEECGSFGGTLLKLRAINSDLGEFEQTSAIDSRGLVIFKSHRIAEIGAGQKDDKIGDSEVFGHSGALVMYRRSALEDCLYRSKRNPTGEYFDEDFFFYKEDADLAWRLRLAGFKSLFVAGARAYHIRSLAENNAKTTGEIVKNRRQQSALARRHSYRNHLFVLIKNESWKNLLRYFPFIFFYELKKIIYILIFEWTTLPAIGDFFRLLPRMLKKRRNNLKQARVSPQEIRKWIK